MSAAAVVWSEPYPGTVLKSCGSTEAIEVHHYAGCALRIGGRASLCFDCGPDGGVYHPDIDGLLQEDELTLDVDEAFARVVKEAKKLNRQYNQFELHSHYDLKRGQSFEHAHAEGSDAHKHPETGPASFTANAKKHRAPVGDDRPWVELDQHEGTFRVVLSYHYVPAVPDQNAPTNRGWTRRRSMEFYVQAIRLQAMGIHADPRGGGAIPMTTKRMQDTFRIKAEYEIVGWRPTGPRRLP